jgi:hypothetical protein
MKKEMYLLEHSTGYIMAGRPWTIRVYSSIASANRGISQLRSNYSDLKIVKITKTEDI